MTDESHTFASTRARLDEIVSQVRKKDTSLEASLDLLEEGVRLANQCTELIDHADWESGDVVSSDPDGVEAPEGEDGSAEEAAAPDSGPGDAGEGDEVAGEPED